MPRLYEGHLVGKGLKFGIVAGRFNEFITNKLLSGALMPSTGMRCRIRT